MPVSDIDRVSVAGAGSFAGTNLELTVSCELMHNQLPASPISPTATKLAVVQDGAAIQSSSASARTAASA